MQQGIDIIIKVIGPDGQQIKEIDTPTGPRGPELVSLVAKSSGTYRIEVRAFRKDVSPGKYEAKVEELLTAAEYDAVKGLAERQRHLAENRRGRERV